MGARWKGKGAESKALENPMSNIISLLQSHLKESDSRGLLSGSCVLLEADVAQVDLLNQACFGRAIISAPRDTQWIQLSMEEGFYLCHSLNCINIVGEDDGVKSHQEIWNYMTSKKETFPDFYKAYSHLRKKNWVVRSGSQYGVDFVAYRHHPAYVHSEYAVLVLSEGDSDGNGRLRVWSDFEGALRLCGSVAKTLLVLYVNRNGSHAKSPECLESCNVEERVITRWIPERGRENQTVARDGSPVS